MSTEATAVARACKSRSPESKEGGVGEASSAAGLDQSRA